MITGFGNNVVSSLAADITENQTTIQVMPGAGAIFAGLLTHDYANSSNTLKAYAKITLTDAKETVFEVCHLLAVNNDILTVVRGQEDTKAKGWSLNDVIANFATRGSENQFVQIEQLQSGHYTSGVAGGTANVLTLALPATYFLNGSTDWVLRAPIVVYPVQNNTGASTLQLTMGGKVLGTFPLYKGNKTALVANDILKDVPLVCLMDSTKTFFNVTNPGAIYAGLGTAAFHDVTKNKKDTDQSHVLLVGDHGLGGQVLSVLNTELSSNYPSGFFLQGGGPNNNHFGGYGSGVHLNYDTTADGLMLSANIFVRADGHLIAEWLAVKPDGTITASRSQDLYGPLNKPTALEIEALPLAGGTMKGEITGAYTGGFLFADQYNTKAPFYNNFNTGSGSDYHPLIKQVGTTSLPASWAFSQGLLNNHGVLSWAFHFKGSAGQEVACYMNTAGDFQANGQIVPGNYTNFDARYQYLGYSYTKAESDSRFSPKNTMWYAVPGWWKCGSTGMIMQWGSVGVGGALLVTFPIAFPNACISVQMSQNSAYYGSDSKANISATDKSRTGFASHVYTHEVGADWLAIGY